MAAKLGIRAYARRRGVSHTAVQKAIATGRLSSSVTRKGKDYQIDPDAADREWAGATDEAQQRPPPPADDDPSQGELFPGAGGKPKTTEGITYARSRAIREAWNARIAALDYQERMGSLVSAETVKLEAYRVARTVRDQLLTLPARLGPSIAAMSEAKEVSELLERELDLALRELTDAVRRA